MRRTCRPFRCPPQPADTILAIRRAKRSAPWLRWIAKARGGAPYGNIVTFGAGASRYQVTTRVHSPASVGAISDRLQRRKLFVLISALVIAVAHILAAFAPSFAVFVVAIGIAGLANGVYLAVDQALIAEVLPSRKNVAKDMGVLHLANVLPQTLVPVLAPLFLAIGANGDNYPALFIGGAVVGIVGAVINQFIKSEFKRSFDSDYAARLVLGVHGRGAPAADVADFAAAMADSLTARYGTSLLDFNTRLTVKVKSEAPLPGGRGVRVTTQRLRAGKDPIPVDYLLRNVGGQWKVFDVMIEGISYVQAFKNQFDAPLGQKSIRQVAADLRAGKLQAGNGKK